MDGIATIFRPKMHYISEVCVP